MEEGKYYTVAERRELLRDVFDNEDTQEMFREYRRYCASLLPDKEELTVQDGFNFCLKMIREATDIDWANVKWKGLDSSMVSWFSALNDHPSSFKQWGKKTSADSIIRKEK